MNIALDLGAHEMRSFWYSGGRFRTRRCQSSCLLIENTNSQQSMLNRMDEPFTQCGEELALIGESASRIGEMLRLPVMPFFPDGRLPSDNPTVRRLVAAVIESMIGRAKDKDDLCTITLPGVTKRGTSLEAEEKKFLTQVVRLLGYHPLIINGSHGVVLAELSSHAFSGIGMTFGASTTELSVVHHGQELAHCVVPYAGTWIDQRLARENEYFLFDVHGNKYLDAMKVNSWKQKFEGSLLKPTGERAGQLADVCRGMLDQTFRQAASIVQEAISTGNLEGPIPLVIAGGTTGLPGFRELLAQSMEEIDFPAIISELRVVENSDFVVARGGLIHAELESSSNQQSIVA